MIILIPLPLFFAQTIFGVRGLEAWVVIGIIWTFCSAITVVMYPLFESREAILMVMKGVIKVRHKVLIPVGGLLNISITTYQHSFL